MKIVVWALAVACAASLPARADWLVLKDGKRVETKGPWTIKGRQVQFTSVKGKLQSLPVAEIDVEASRKVTGPAPELARREALFEGQPVILPSEEVEVPANAKVGDLQRFIKNPNAPRVRGTLSMSKSFVGDLYEIYPELKRLRASVAARVGEDEVKALEERIEKYHAEIFSDCQQAGADQSTDLQDPCHGMILAGALIEHGDGVVR